MNSNYSPRYITKGIENRNSNKYTYMHAHSNTGRDSQEGGNSPIIHRLRMGKEIGLHTYYRIAFNQKRNKYGFILQRR